MTSTETSILGKLKCFFGWHKWSWSLQDGDVLTGKISGRANCKRCGINFKTGRVL